MQEYFFEDYNNDAMQLINFPSQVGMFNAAIRETPSSNEGSKLFSYFF